MYTVGSGMYTYGVDPDKISQSISDKATTTIRIKQSPKCKMKTKDYKNRLSVL